MAVIIMYNDDASADYTVAMKPFIAFEVQELQHASKHVQQRKAYTCTTHCDFF